MMEDNQIEILVLIDEFIRDISKQNIVDTSTVIDRMLDIRLAYERTIVPV
jgi:hypothetical protein